MSEQSTERGIDNSKPPPPTRGQRLAAFGFLGAFGLTILTVLLTGLMVGAPNVRHVLQPAPAASEERAPRAEGETSTGSSSAAPSAPAVPPPSVSEPSTNEDAARADADRGPDGAVRKDARKHASDSRAKDAR